MEKKWYVIKTRPNCEKLAKKNLQENVNCKKFNDFFGDIIISVNEKTKKANYPGYVFVEMFLNDETHSLVQNTDKIMGFICTGHDPSVVKQSEMNNIRINVPLPAKPKKIEYSVGDNICVIDGPFANFSGIIEEINKEKLKAKIKISIFGREMPVELELKQIRAKSS